MRRECTDSGDPAVHIDGQRGPRHPGQDRGGGDGPQLVQRAVMRLAQLGFGQRDTRSTNAMVVGCTVAAGPDTSTAPIT